ncbi:hypothetical protein J4714_13860 [Staphylococcus epidermidis]|nr:hypothetical protein [Staphylococcus epidermidis]
MRTAARAPLARPQHRRRYAALPAHAGQRCWHRSHAGPCPDAMAHVAQAWRPLHQ